jgi:hypothetical protein
MKRIGAGFEPFGAELRLEKGPYHKIILAYHNVLTHRLRVVRFRKPYGPESRPTPFGSNPARSYAITW